MQNKKITLNSNVIGRSMLIKGHTLHFVDSDGKKPIVLLHGLGFSLYSMRNVFNDLLDREYRVIALDLPGCGYSTAAPRVRLTPDEIAEVLHEFLKALDIEHANFYAIAEGAIYALRLAQMYPENVSSLLLTSPGSLTRHYPARYRHLATPIIGEAIVKLMKRKHTDQFLRWIMFDETSINATVERQTYQPFVSKDAKLGLLNMLRDYQDIKVFANLNQVDCATLMLWGEYDCGHPVAMCDLFMKKIERVAERIIPNCAHLVHEERPRLVSDIIDRFLLKNSREYLHIDEENKTFI